MEQEPPEKQSCRDGGATMTEVAGKSRVNRPYFFRETDGSRMEVPAFDVGQGDLEGNQLREFNMYVQARQIELTAPESEPENTALPEIAGDVELGGVLTASPGTWTGNPSPTLTYQWRSEGVDIVGATDQTYTIEAVGVLITVEVTATNSAGSATVESEQVGPVPAIPPANTVAPAITGTPTVGQALTVTNGTWTGNPSPTLTRQWRRDATNIASATGTTYTLVAADVGQDITCVVTATNSGGTETATANSIGPVAGIAPSFTVDPVLSGTPTVGETLTVTNGTAGGTPAATFARAWLRDGTEIAEATGATHVLTEDDVDALLSVQVTATNSAGSDVVISNELGPAVAAEPEA